MCQFLVPGLGRSPGGGKWQLTPVFSPENPVDRGGWQVTVQRVTENGTGLSNYTRMSGQFLIKSNTYLVYNLTIPRVGVSPGEIKTYIHAEACTEC